MSERTGRTAGAALSVVVAAAAIATVVPLAHGHLGLGSQGCGWYDAAPQTGGTTPDSGPCLLCLATAQLRATPAAEAALLPTPPGTLQTAPSQSPSLRAPALRGPAEPRAPPA